jgi:hypothetical protein
LGATEAVELCIERVIEVYVAAYLLPKVRIMLETHRNFVVRGVSFAFYGGGEALRRGGGERMGRR